MNFDDEMLRAAYYCVHRELMTRRRGGLPIPSALSRLRDRLDLEMRVSQSRPENDCDGEQSDATELLGARDAAALLGCSTRQAQRLAADLDAENVCGRWLFRRRTVLDYVKRRNENG